MRASVPDQPRDDGPPRAGGRGSVLRRLFRRGPSPEERLTALIEAHRRDLDRRRERFEQTIEDLERREQLLSDARASVERLLRLGSKDLDARETDLARLVVELTEREQRIREEEAALERRRSEVGAVELHRARVEQRERAVAEREALVAERERRLQERAPDDPRLAFVPGTGYRLVELAAGAVGPGCTVVVDGERYAIARVGPSPLPRDDRRCAYLVRGLRAEPSGGSS